MTKDERIKELEAELSELDPNYGMLKRLYSDVEQQRRDQFAAAALTGILAGHNLGGTCEEFSKSAYRYADAMMSEREKRGKK